MVQYTYSVDGFRWKGHNLQKQFWRYAKSSYLEDFYDELKKLDKIAQGSVESLLTYAPATWYRAFFTYSCKSDVIDNNMCGAFSGSILEVRYKHIVSLLEDVRVYVINRIYKKRKESNTYHTFISSSAVKCLEDNM